MSVKVLSKDHRIIIFASDIGLKILAKSKRIHCDGTFISAPSQFEQVYIIHGEYKGNIMHFVFALLTGKSEKLFRKMIEEINFGVLNLGLDIRNDFQQIFVDFEQAAIKTFSYHFPQSKIKGCFSITANVCIESW